MREAYDSGMSDWTTANAISRAVARLVGLDASQRLVRLKRRTAGDDGATVVIDGVIELRVPGEAIKKLWSVETGGSSEPFAFLLDLPREERRPAAAILRQSAVPWSQLMRCINSVFL